MNRKKTRCRLVPLTMAHATKRWLGWLRDKDSRRWIFAAKGRQSLKALRRTVRAWEIAPNTLAYAIEASWKPGVWVHIGNVKADIHHNGDGDVAVVGILMGPEVRGLGYGPQALRMVTRRLKRARPTITRVDAGIHGRNWASCRAFEKAGFTVEYPAQIWARRKV